MTMFITIIVVSLVTTGIWIVTAGGFLLDKPASLLRNNLPQWILKPFFECLVCMSGIYGVTGALISEPHTLNLLWKIPVICFGVAGLNSIILQSYPKPDKDE